jgi:hypothetical protein
MTATARFTAAWQPYLPTIAALCPTSDDQEAELRARLMLLRDLANADQRSSTWEASQVLAAVEALAAAHVLTPMPLDMLAATRVGLIRLYRVAREIEATFHQPEAAA